MSLKPSISKFFIVFYLCGLAWTNIASANFALVRAALMGDIPKLQNELGSGANVNFQTPDGTALVVAATYGKEKAVELLLKQPGVVVTAVNDQGLNALELASPNAAVICLLLKTDQFTEQSIQKAIEKHSLHENRDNITELLVDKYCEMIFRGKSGAELDELERATQQVLQSRFISAFDQWRKGILPRLAKFREQ